MSGRISEAEGFRNENSAYVVPSKSVHHEDESLALGPLPEKYIHRLRKTSKELKDAGQDMQSESKSQAIQKSNSEEEYGRKFKHVDGRVQLERKPDVDGTVTGKNELPNEIATVLPQDTEDDPVAPERNNNISSGILESLSEQNDLGRLNFSYEEDTVPSSIDTDQNQGVAGISGVAAKQPDVQYMQQMKRQTVLRKEGHEKQNGNRMKGGEKECPILSFDGVFEMNEHGVAGCAKRSKEYTVDEISEKDPDQQKCVDDEGKSKMRRKLEMQKDKESDKDIHSEVNYIENDGFDCGEECKHDQIQNEAPNLNTKTEAITASNKQSSMICINQLKAKLKVVCMVFLIALVLALFFAPPISF